MLGKVWTVANADRVMRYLRKNPGASLRDLAKATGISYETIRTHLVESSIVLAKNRSNVKDYAKKWGCCNCTILHLIQTGKLKAIKIKGVYYITPGQRNPRICRIKGCKEPVGEGRVYYCGPAHQAEGQRLSLYRWQWKHINERRRREGRAGSKGQKKGEDLNPRPLLARYSNPGSESPGVTLGRHKLSHCGLPHNVDMSVSLHITSF